MAFSDLALKAAVESGIIAAHKNIAKLNLFAKNYSELDGVYGASVAVPVYNLSASTEFNASTNNYATTETPGGCMVTLNKHFVKSVGITDKQEAETGIRWISDTTYALADNLTRAVNKTVFNSLSSDSITLSASVTLTSKSAIANLVETAYENDIAVSDAVVVLCPTTYASVLAQLDSSVFGGDEAVKYGYVPNLYGFAGFVCSGDIPSSLSAEGFIIQKDAIALANRYLPSYTEGTYQETWKSVTEEGFNIGFRRFADPSTGMNILAGDVLFGSTIVLPSKIVKLM